MHFIDYIHSFYHNKGFWSKVERCKITLLLYREHPVSSYLTALSVAALTMTHELTHVMMAVTVMIKNDTHYTLSEIRTHL